MGNSLKRKIGDICTVHHEEGNKNSKWRGRVVEITELCGGADENDAHYEVKTQNGDIYWFDDEELEDYGKSEEHVAVAEGSKEETDKSLGLVENEQYTGSSSDYYKVFVNNPTTLPEPYFAECNDLIEALQMTFAEGNAFKAIWRKAKARQGVKKKGYDNGVYDSEKVVFFGERMLVQAKENT